MKTVRFKHGCTTWNTDERRESEGKGEKQHGQRFYIAVANYLHKQISPGANPTCQQRLALSLTLYMQSSLAHSSRQLYFSRPLFRIYGHCDFRLIRLIRVDYFRRICKSATSACKIWRRVEPQERRLIASARRTGGGGEGGGLNNLILAPFYLHS